MRKDLEADPFLVAELITETLGEELPDKTAPSVRSIYFPFSIKLIESHSVYKLIKGHMGIKKIFDETSFNCLILSGQ